MSSYQNKNIYIHNKYYYLSVKSHRHDYFPRAYNLHIIVLDDDVW